MQQGQRPITRCSLGDTLKEVADIRYVLPTALRSCNLEAIFALRAQIWPRGDITRATSAMLPPTVREPMISRVVSA